MEVLENLQPKFRIYFSDSSFEVTNISILFPPRQPTMNSSGSSGSTSGSISSQDSTYSLIRSMYNHYNLVVSTTNFSKLIKQYDLFKFEEDANDTLSHVSSPIDLALATTPLPKFKDNFPTVSGNDTISIIEHLISFSNACHNIGENKNDTCMRLFVNSLEWKAAIDLFELPPNIFSTWVELSYWFMSTYGKPQSHADLLKDYNNLIYNKAETIKYFNFCSPNYTIIFRKLLDLIIRMH
jgi:hypothetical protein